MHPGTEQLAEALHHSLNPFLHFNLAKRAALLKEPSERVHEHASSLPEQVLGVIRREPLRAPGKALDFSSLKAS